MDINKLYKNVCNFERKVLNIGTHTDTMSDIDMAILSDKLNIYTKQAMKKLAGAFRIKLAQGDPFATMDARTDEEKDLGYRARQALDTLQPNATLGSFSPDTAHYYFPHMYLAKNVLELKAVADQATPLLQECTEAHKIYQDQYNTMSQEARDKYHAYFAACDKLRSVTDGRLTYGDDNFASKIQDIKDIINQLETNKTEQQNQEAQDFISKEKSELATQRKAIEGRLAFTPHDAARIVNSSAADIKAAFHKANIGVTTVTFNFNSNGTISVVSTNIKAANLLRRDFIMSLQLNLKQYLINTKKFFSSAPVVFTLTV